MRNFSNNIGDDIKDIVQNAMNTMNFNQLNRDIGNTVKGAIDEVRRSLDSNRRDMHDSCDPNEYREHWKQGDYRNRSNSREDSYREPFDEYRSNQTFQGRSNGPFHGTQGGNGPFQGSQRNNGPFRGRQASNGPFQGTQTKDNVFRRYQNSSQAPPNSTRNSAHGMNPSNTKGKELVPFVPVGKLSGQVLTVTGSIGFVTFTTGAFILSLYDHVLMNFDFFGSLALALVPFIFGSLYFWWKGSRIRKRVQRFYRYLGILRGHGYYSLKELSVNTGYRKRYLLKDLRNMISLGMFPEGHIDEQETCLILNRESYNQYMELQRNLGTQDAKEQTNEQTKDGVGANRMDPSDSRQAQGSKASMSPELRKAIEVGQFYMDQIREANEAIPGEEVSSKLYRLEEVIRKIFQYVELHPSQLSEIQKFMDYYLPTTLKLVNAYKEFDNQPIQGDNIMTAKKEIESTLDTINTAFENLLDSLFEDAAMDVSTDISVLQAMLAQEGLTQDDFIKMRKAGGRINE